MTATDHSSRVAHPLYAGPAAYQTVMNEALHYGSLKVKLDDGAFSVDSERAFSVCLPRSRQ